MIELTYEYGWYDSHPDGDWKAKAEPQPDPKIYWHVFGFLTHDTADSAQGTGRKSAYGSPVIVRRIVGHTEWEHVDDHQ